MRDKAYKKNRGAGQDYPDAAVRLAQQAREARIFMGYEQQKPGENLAVAEVSNRNNILGILDPVMVPHFEPQADEAKTPVEKLVKMPFGMILALK